MDRSNMQQSLIWKLALRNVFRNRRRTLLTVFLIACGLAALMFTDAMVRGMTRSMVNIATGTVLGQAQVHRQGFRRNYDVDLFISGSDAVVQALRQDPAVAVAAPRVISGAMLASSENVAAAMVYGIDPLAEARLGKLQQAMVQGQYLDSTAPTQLLLGYKLAQLLEVELGDRVVLTVSQIHGGDLSQELFRVSGVFRFNDRMLDQNLAFISIPRAQQLLGMSAADAEAGGRQIGVHEIALRFNAATIPGFDWQRYNADWNGVTLETLLWDKLIPQLSGVLEMSNYSTLIVAGILFVLVSLGLINSMFMSIYERQYEFGVLLALGTRRSHLFWQIVCEGFLLGAISAALGVVLGGGLSYWKAVTGFDYGQLEMSGVTLQEPIYLILHWGQFTWMPLVIVLMSVTACLYPALHGARLQPTRAMRKTL